MRKTNERIYQNDVAINWSQLSEKGIKPAISNIFRAQRLCPAMLTKMGHSAHIKLKSQGNSEVWQLVLFDIEYVRGKLSSEILNPLGLNNLRELAKILENENKNQSDQQV